MVVRIKAGLTVSGGALLAGSPDAGVSGWFIELPLEVASMVGRSAAADTAGSADEVNGYMRGPIGLDVCCRAFWWLPSSHGNKKVGWPSTSGVV
jgi:hypothetical protein